MGFIQDYEQYDSLGLAELVRQRQVTALELCEAPLKESTATTPCSMRSSGQCLKKDEKQHPNRNRMRPLPVSHFCFKDLGYAYAGVPLPMAAGPLTHTSLKRTARWSPASRKPAWPS
jgi:hypothetical protein